MTRAGFTVLDFNQLRETIMGGCLVDAVDAARDIATAIGARPYQVALVHTKWTGGVRGDGVEEVVRRELIVPTPLCSTHNSLTNTLQPIGSDEVGSIKVSEISVAYSEDCLMGRDADGNIAEDEQFFWEIAVALESGGSILRRFTPRSTPAKDSERMEWSVDLLRSSEDRARDGSVR